MIKRKSDLSNSSVFALCVLSYFALVGLIALSLGCSNVEENKIYDTQYLDSFIGKTVYNISTSRHKSDIIIVFNDKTSLNINSPRYSLIITESEAKIE